MVVQRSLLSRSGKVAKHRTASCFRTDTVEREPSELVIMFDVGTPFVKKKRSHPFLFFSMSTMVAVYLDRYGGSMSKRREK